MAGPAGNKKTYGMKIGEMDSSLQLLFGLSQTPVLSSIIVGSNPNIANSEINNDPTGEAQKLKTMGDTMVGAIAYLPDAVTIDSNGQIDVDDTGSSYTSYLIVAGYQNNDDDLVTISNPTHAGQLLYIQAIATTTITLKHNTGNIYIPGGSDFVINAGSFATLLWDVTVHPNKWVLIGSSSGATGGGGANLTLSNLTDPTTINANLEPDNTAGTANERDLGHDDKIWAKAYIKDIYNTGLIKTESTDHELQFYTGGGQRLAISDNSSNGAGYAELFGVIAGSGETQTHPSYKTVATDASPADNDMVGALGFDGYNSTTTRLTWARMVGVSDVVTNNSETAHFEFKALQSGTEKTMLETDQFGIYLSNDMSGGSSPAYNGAIYRDGNDIKCYTGGAEKSLSDIGTGGGGWVGTATSNLDMDDFHIIGIGELDLDGVTATIKGIANLNFYHTGRNLTSLGTFSGLHYEVNSNEAHKFSVGGAHELQVSASYIDVSHWNGSSSTAKRITYVATPLTSTDAVNKSYCDGNSGGGGANTSLSNLSNVSVNTTLNMNSNNITNVNDLDVDDDLTVDGTTDLNGNVDLGNSSGDDIDLYGKLDVKNNYTVYFMATPSSIQGWLDVTVNNTAYKIPFF